MTAGAGTTVPLRGVTRKPLWRALGITAFSVLSIPLVAVLVYWSGENDDDAWEAGIAAASPGFWVLAVGVAVVLAGLLASWAVLVRPMPALETLADTAYWVSVVGACLAVAYLSILYVGFPVLDTLLG